MIVPETITVRVCPVCGQTDRYSTLGRAKHFARGQRCFGDPLELTYRLVDEFSGALSERSSGEVDGQ